MQSKKKRREMQKLLSVNRYFGFVVLTSVLATVIFLVSPPTILAQGGAFVGIPRGGENAYESLGRSDQDGPVLRHYGYLTHIFGSPDAALFSDPTTRTEATARFTFVATTTWDARHEFGNIIVTSAPGTVTIFFNEAPSADFDNPESFASGQPIATFSVRYYNVLNVQAPGQGNSSLVADLIQQSTNSFTLNGRLLRLGRRGLQERIQASGQGTRIQVDPVRAFFLLGASAVVTKH